MLPTSPCLSHFPGCQFRIAQDPARSLNLRCGLVSSTLHQLTPSLDHHPAASTRNSGRRSLGLKSLDIFHCSCLFFVSFLRVCKLFFVRLLCGFYLSFFPFLFTGEVANYSFWSALPHLMVLMTIFRAGYSTRILITCLVRLVLL